MRQLQKRLYEFWASSGTPNQPNLKEWETFCVNLVKAIRSDIPDSAVSGYELQKVITQKWLEDGAEEGSKALPPKWDRLML